MILMNEQETTTGNTKNKWVYYCLGLKTISSGFHKFDFFFFLSYFYVSYEEET